MLNPVQVNTTYLKEITSKQTPGNVKKGKKNKKRNGNHGADQAG